MQLDIRDGQGARRLVKTVLVVGKCGSMCHRLAGVAWLALATLLVVTGPVSAASEGYPQRFSVAISGGASKGAYEAGLNWALLTVMRRLGQADPVLGGAFRPIELASFAGTSAGGINTLLSGLVWCSRRESEGGLPDRIDDNLFRDIWLLPDVNHLLPRTADSPYYLPDDALLSRKDLVEGARLLRESWHKPAFRDGCEVPLGVAVTRVEPEVLQVAGVAVPNQRFLIPFELRVQPDASAAFFFDPASYPQLGDPAMILLPRLRDAAPFSIEDERIVRTILTTSAFPIGFGRKRLQYCRLEAFRGVDAGEAPDAEVAHLRDSGLVCPEGYGLAEAEFADGGLFDNLPLGLARTLAEESADAAANPLPVSYIYLDPNRVRFEIPEPKTARLCEQIAAPEACRKMEFGIRSESRLLLDALGTARKFELYRELTSANWAFNLSQLTYSLADTVAVANSPARCSAELPYFDAALDCAQSLRRAGRLLELAYDHIDVPITAPYSVARLSRAGVIKSCREVRPEIDVQVQALCRIDLVRYRSKLASASLAVLARSTLVTPGLEQRIRASKLSMHTDRVIRVSSRGAPITGTLLGDFGAFLDRKFREYDYYAGVYDAVVLVAETSCGIQFSRKRQVLEFWQCMDARSEHFYALLDVTSDPSADAVFALLARDEFADREELRFAYEPMPRQAPDMRIIHDGLSKSLAAGQSANTGGEEPTSVETEFFAHLRAEGFRPTPMADGSEPLLAAIMADPNNWTHELVRRSTSRLVYLERQAEDVFAAREPDPKERESSITEVMGATAHVLQSATYTYPSFTFAPSTAPQGWIWRNIIPYEIAFDFAQGDTLFTWQPTWSLSPRDLLGIRASVGFAGGPLGDNSLKGRENYVSIGPDWTRLTRHKTLSSWGLTPAYYHYLSNPEEPDRNSFGGDVHVGLLNNRLRLSLGTRDFGDVRDNWFLLIGIADIPGAIYWFTR